MYVYVWSLFLPPSGELWNWRKLKQHEHMLYTVATRLSSDNSASRKKESKKESKQSSNKEWMNEWTHEWIMDEGMYVCEGMNEWFTLFHPFVLKAVWTNTSFTKCGALYTGVFRSLLWFTINYVALSCARGISLRSATPRRSALAVPRCWARGDLIYI